MGRILDEITRKMTTKVIKGKDDPLKILVHSTHDTAIAALCSTLDVFDEKYVDFSDLPCNMLIFHLDGQRLRLLLRLNYSKT